MDRQMEMVQIGIGKDPLSGKKVFVCQIGGKAKVISKKEYNKLAKLLHRI